MAYSPRVVDLFNGASLAPEFMALNPQGTVPVLQDKAKDVLITDSRWAGSAGEQSGVCALGTTVRQRRQATASTGSHARVDACVCDSAGRVLARQCWLRCCALLCAQADRGLCQQPAAWAAGW